MYSFNDYLLLCSQTKRKHPSLRIGQTYWNVLHDIFPDWAEELQTYEMFDCYNDDNKVGSFLYEVGAMWDTRVRRHKRDRGRI